MKNSQKIDENSQKIDENSQKIDENPRDSNINGPVVKTNKCASKASYFYVSIFRVKLKKRQQTKTTTTTSTTTTTTRSPAVQYRTGGRHSRLRSVTSFKAFFPGTSGTKPFNQCSLRKT